MSENVYTWEKKAGYSFSYFKTAEASTISKGQSF